MGKTKSLNCLSVSDKLKIIQQINKGISRKQIAEKYNISESTISRIVKNKEKLENLTGISNIERKRFKKGHYESVDAAVLSWFQQIKSTGADVSGPMILEKAKMFAIDMSIDFKPNNGWLSRWKCKNNVTFRKVQGEKHVADDSSATYWLQHVLPSLLEKYHEEDIFNADESSLFFKAVPTGTMGFAGEDPLGYMLNKTRIALLFLCNMTGTEKEIYSIGKFQNPYSFRGKNIPTKYYFNQKAWMAQDLWIQILAELNTRMQKSNRKILIFADSAAYHNVPASVQLSNIELSYIPNNKTVIVQPLHQGIIRTFKVYYRQEIIRKQILAAEMQIDLKLKDFYKSVSLLDVMQMVKRAWCLVSPKTISNCFRKAKFWKQGNEAQSQPEDVSIEGDDIEIPTNISQEEFAALIDVDQNEACFGDMDDNEIIDFVSFQNCTEISEDDGFLPNQDNVSRLNALNALDTVRLYLQQNDQPVDSVDDVEKVLFTMQHNFVQTSIKDFFK